ncbi:sulfurtransferase [Mycolicibacterium goodii]|uniref:sulfurtransferase n=1 Tax=Mycolicibacterium goodii TaxID=134601 RepID=UPI00093E018B|nr:sulfurtransferase [Mycolicibacterium goodii]OKH68552.1 thiosulfate sulfurtransferase [Mycobacterium sp. SWH-M5]MBU8811644.1 sulfurtransferase [Mycolicibacterium goodii]MBU8815273.1 sulfurtransferase [Mycolicibacterium goodii]MBU8828665.1 sulfurtransferase [Mycolicibacterium goodii]ULN50609.1 sulfurtransferase [Mycolicibacterium goodii]
MATTRSDVFVSTAELIQLIAAGGPVTLLDVRWTLAEPNGEQAYLDGHLPGAVYVSLEDELADHRVTGRGRHPLPSGRDLEAAARRWGVRDGVPTVVYDDWNRAGSARAWWCLTAAGITGVRILDGGFGAWVDGGGGVETGPVTPEPGDVHVTHDDLYRGALPTLTAGDVQSAKALLDARAPERFRGEVEPVDPVAGHIPGAVNLPSTGLLNPDGTLRGEAEVQALLSDRGVTGAAVGAYCGSGVTAALTVAGLAAAGVDAALFPGSWSEWVSDPDRPVARGER